jgi:hypothetical protein
MTVIAWDGHMLAADKQVTSAGLVHRCTKIQKHNGKLLGMTGDYDVATEMCMWFKAGADPEKFPAKAREDKATLVVIDHTGIYSYCTGPYPLRYEDKKAAWGSGRDFATAVMHLGRDAVEAVLTACVFSCDCGGGHDWLTLDAVAVQPQGDRLWHNQQPPNSNFINF